MPQARALGVHLQSGLGQVFRATSRFDQSRLSICSKPEDLLQLFLIWLDHPDHPFSRFFLRRFYVARFVQTSAALVGTATSGYGPG